MFLKNGGGIPKLFFLFFLCCGIFRAQSSSPDSSVSKVLSTCKKVEDENRFVSTVNPDSLHSLPIGIVKEFNGTRYIIAIDSATFRPGLSTFSAYMALEFPGSQQKIAFAAKNIGFNPTGVLLSNSSRLVLVSQHRISLGPKIAMVLKADGTNYVEWNCNGFAAVNLKGYFEFEPGMIYPDSTSSADTVVRASFEIHCNDIHNFICQINMMPFKIRGLKDFSFIVNDASADFSELSKVPAMTFPSGYNFPDATTDVMWTGFYLKNLTVKLPKELNKSNGQRPSIYVNDLILDNSGITGNFGANNIFGTNEASMSGWAFSVSNINLNIVQNHLNGAGLKGKIKIPISENTEFNYTAQLSQNSTTNELDYGFSIAPANNIDMQIFSASMTIYNTSVITVVKNSGRFIPKAKLNGYLSINENSWKSPGIEFEQIVIGNNSPYIESGTFALVGLGQGTAGNFPISITEIGLTIHPTSPSIFADVQINMMASQDFSFSSGTRIFAVGKITPPATQFDKAKLEFDKVMVNNIYIAVETQPFSLMGTVFYKKNDPVYGNGFFGGFQLKVTDVLDQPISSNVWFGCVNNMKYWYVDATAPIAFEIPTGIEIKRLKGALYYHMKQNQSAHFLASNIQNNSTLSTPLSFAPDSTISLGFRAGVYFIVLPNEKSGNGDVEFEIEFNSSANGGGLNHVALDGNVWFMATVAERQSGTGHKCTGSIHMLYDNMAKTFDATLTVSLIMPKISGNAQCKIHVDPQHWYLCVGRPSQKATISVEGIGNISAYIMVGNELEPMPPIPSQITNIVNCSGLQQGRNTNDLKDAKGWVTGASLSVSKSGDFGFDFFSVYYGFWAMAGFDIMLANYGPSSHCSGSSDALGINGFYAQGQLYAYLSGNVGVRGTVWHQDFDFNILNLSAGAILAGQAPKPTYATGGIGCDYEIFGAFSGHFDFGFEMGNYCTVQQ